MEREPNPSNMASFMFAMAEFKRPPGNVHGIGRKRSSPGLHDVWIREIRRDHPIVFLDGRAQKQRPGVSHPELEAAQKAGTAMVEALLAEAHRLDVGQIVEHRERLPGLQRSRFRLRPQRTRQNVELISDPDDLVHVLYLVLALQRLIVLIFRGS